jgi:DNA gyrase/topoisomerase IV subunit A
MNDIPHKIALRITGEMVELLSELIKSSFDDLEVNFETKTVALDYQKPHEMQLKELLAEFD